MTKSIEVRLASLLLSFARTSLKLTRIRYECIVPRFELLEGSCRIARRRDSQRSGTTFEHPRNCEIQFVESQQTRFVDSSVTPIAIRLIEQNLCSSMSPPLSFESQLRRSRRESSREIDFQRSSIRVRVSKQSERTSPASLRSSRGDPQHR